MLGLLCGIIGVSSIFSFHYIYLGVGERFYIFVLVFSLAKIYSSLDF